MLEFLSSIEGQIAVGITLTGSFLALLANIEKIQTWFASQWNKHVERRDAYKDIKDMVIGLDKRFDAVDKRFDAVDKRFDASDARVKKIEEDIVKLTKDLYNNTESTAAMMLEKMMWSYHFYVLDNNPIPLNVQTALCVMFDQYKLCDWHNHIPENFKEKIMECDIAR